MSRARVTQIMDLLNLDPAIQEALLFLPRVERGRDRTEERIIPESHPVPQGFERTDLRYEVGQVYLQTNKGERRAYGSYYTPDNIVNHIVERTLGPLCEQISNQIDSEIEALDSGPGSEEAIHRLTMEFDDRILKVRVLDPAMGSGHFLLRACTYLAEEIATHPHTYDEAVEQLGTDESALIFWKRRVAENCLYGVDLNDLAVELAKLAMWLETVAVDQPLTFLNHHFRHGNSLIGARIANLDALPDSPPLRATCSPASSRTRSRCCWSRSRRYCRRRRRPWIRSSRSSSCTAIWSASVLPSVSWLTSGRRRLLYLSSSVPTSTTTVGSSTKSAGHGDSLRRLNRRHSGKRSPRQCSHTSRRCIGRSSSRKSSLTKTGIRDRGQGSMRSSGTRRTTSCQNWNLDTI